MNPPDLSLILIMILFWVTYIVVQRFLIGPVGAVITERRQRIDTAEREFSSKHDDFVSATERLESELDEAAREAGAIRADHRQKAAAARQQAVDEARARADVRLQEAVSELSAEAETARDELRRRADELAKLFATQLLGREVRS